MMKADERKAKQRFLDRENAKWPWYLVRIPEEQWPVIRPKPLELWRSCDFVLQVYATPDPGVIRLSVNRTLLARNGRWEENISWDDLQRLKRECGRGDLDAVEVFPADRDVVNVSNMRHLFVFSQPLSFAWRSKS